MFSYRKLYADLITDSGLVCVVYVAELELLGTRSSSAGYECYTPDGRRRVLRASGAVAVALEPRHITLSFDTQTGPFSYRLERTNDAFAQHRPSPRLGWQILTAMSPARATGVLDEGELLGFGYSDRVELGAPPRALGLSELAWGRGRTGSENFVFTEARFRDRSVFRRAVLNGASLDDFALARGERSLELALGASRFELEEERCLHAGNAVDEQRFPSALERSLSRVLSGNVHEMRALACVRGKNHESGLALHERVYFGAH